MYRTRDPRSDLAEYICPRCRFAVVVPSGESPRWGACPRDGWPLVSRDAYLRCDGDPLIGLELEGGFTPVEVAGSGATSTVYKARREGHGLAAVKVVRLDGPLGERAADAWQREVAALEGLSAHGVVRMLDTGRVTQPPAFFVALDWVEGQSLDAVTTPLPVDRAIAIASAAGRALGELHAHGVVHGDIKPGNILVDGDALTLVDLGSSRREGLRGPAFEDEGWIGSPSYAAPEVLDGNPVDRRTDLYSLGCLLYRLLTGHPPFTGSAEAVVRAHRVATAPPPSASIDAPPEGLDELVASLLEKERSFRPANVGAVLARMKVYARFPNV